jgi:hypothetical protein
MLDITAKHLAFAAFGAYVEIDQQTVHRINVRFKIID